MRPAVLVSSVRLMKIRQLVSAVVLVAVSACGTKDVVPPASPGAAAPAQGAAVAAGRPASSLSDPLQLTMNPCILVTQAEAEKAVGATVTQGVGSDGTVCTYDAKGDSGLVTVVLQAPMWCKLLFLALKENLFGNTQVRRDDVGDGGMQVVGNGNVQFTSHGGCVEVEGSTATGKLPDAVVLQMAKNAAGRVTG